MKALKNISLSLLTGIILAISWPETANQAWLIFIAFAPLFFAIDKTQNWRAVFLYSFLSFIVWHLLTVWWMWYSTPIGSLSAWIINSMLMAGIISLAKFSSNRLKWITFEIILAFYWLAFEIFHLYWDLKWPWMYLGHAFANHTEWIQWYEYLGVYGGGFWVIISNGLIFRLLKDPGLIPKKVYPLILTLTIILGPIFYSYTLLKKDLSNDSSIKVSIVQPNVDTYTEKFNAIPPLQQSEMIIEMLINADSNSIIILPETAIPESFNKTDPYPKSVDTLLKFAKINSLKIIGGFYTKDKNNSYNSVCLIEDGLIKATRNKIKLLAYAEQIPFDYISVFWSQIVHKKGGIAESFGVDEQAKVFTLDDSQKLGTLICFESVFPDITAEMCRNGAQALFIITNDDWWQDSPGYRQHFAYARIKAIENRKWIARSANTGISGIINNKGEIITSSGFKEKCVLKSDIELHQKNTFFCKNEKHFRIVIISLSVILIISSLLKRVKSNTRSI